MPNHERRSYLYSDTSKFAADSALYQIQNGKLKLIVYASKRLSEAARNYSITELELCGLAINIASFSHFLERIDFDAIVDYLALTHIINSKAEPATPRMKRLLELISSYLFNLYYMRGKGMILSDFLSRQTHDDSNPHDVIPISFNMYNTLYENYYNIEIEIKYLVQMRSQTKVTGIMLPEVHGTKKMLQTNELLEKQKPLIQENQVDKNRPRLGRGKAGIKCKKPQPVVDTTVSVSKPCKIPTTQNVTKDSMAFPVPKQLITNEIETVTTKQIPSINTEQTFHPDSIYRTLPRPLENL